MSLRTFYRIVLTLLIAAFFTPRTAEAIPAFAPKYKLSCSTCHSAAPKLKAYGEDFAGNAFRLPDGPEPKREFVDTGDDELILHRFLPLAIRFDGFVQAADRDKGKIDFETPYGIKLMSGGPIMDDVSYYLYFYMGERGEVAGLEDAYVHFNNLFGSDLDIMAGQFQVSDPLFKRELRLTFEDYQIYKMSPDASKADLTYDRGLMVTYGLEFGLDLVGQILNGNGIKPAENRIFDFDDGKSLVFRASQSIGPVRIGAFVYRGEERNSSDYKNIVQFYGPDLTVGNDVLELNVQYLRREDDNVGASTANKLKSTMEGGMAEVVFMPEADRSKWLIAGLYNYINGDGDTYDYHTATLSISHMAARNLRILTECTYDIINGKPKFTVGFVSAF